MPEEAERTVLFREGEGGNGGVQVGVGGSFGLAVFGVGSADFFLQRNCGRQRLRVQFGRHLPNCLAQLISVSQQVTKQYEYIGFNHF